MNKAWDWKVFNGGQTSSEHDFEDVTHYPVENGWKQAMVLDEERQGL